MSAAAGDGRLTSLDAFRGFAIAGMVLVNNPGDWKAVHPPLAHAPWHGWTFADWIFPFFLFIVGVSMTLSLGQRAAAGATHGRLLAGMARRAAVIFTVGLVLNLLPSFDFSTVRIPGVLQRIALCSLLAVPIVLACGWRGVAGWIVALFVVYTVPMLWVPVPDAQGVVAAGVLQPGQDFAAWLDRLLLGGHLWAQARTWDPEGLWTTLPAVATVLFGVLTGRWLATERPAAERCVWLLLAGLALVWLGEVMGRLVMPVNKPLWTPSFTVMMAGFALLVFGAFYWLLDGTADARLRTAARRLAHPLVVYGMNALFIFAFSGVVARMLGFIKLEGGTRSLKAVLYAPIQALPVSPETASLVWALLFQAAMYAVAWGMWRRRWFVKA